MMRGFFCPFRIKILPFRLRTNNALRVLDVGCGSHSPTITKKWLSGCTYHGVDRAMYQNDAGDIGRMDRFFDIDLSEDDLTAIPEGSYDLVIFAHVIEHLHNGIEVLERLSKKLAPGGYLYVETPSERSLRLPSMPGTLNFYDDSTHVRVYGSVEIADALRQQGLEIVRAGTRRDRLRIILAPLMFPLRYLVQRDKAAGDLWDVLGFASHVLAMRPA